MTLTHVNGAIHESGTTTSNAMVATCNCYGIGSSGGTAGLTSGYSTYTFEPVYWGSYPVYVCTDKTKKAIAVLQALEADGLKVTSVPKFIKLVEKIASLL